MCVCLGFSFVRGRKIESFFLTRSHTTRRKHSTMSALRRTIRGRIKSLLVVVFLLLCSSCCHILVFFFFFFWWWRDRMWLKMCFVVYVSFFLTFPILFFSRFPVERECANLCIIRENSSSSVWCASLFVISVLFEREYWFYQTLFTDALFLWWTNNKQMSPHEQRRKKEHHQKYRDGRWPPSRLFLPRRTRKWTRIKSATPRTSNGTKVPWMCKLGRKLWARKDASCGLPVCPAPGRAPWRIRSSTSCLKEGTKSSLWTGITSDTD